jgi:hypothetical protein
MKTCVGRESVYIHVFLTSALVGGKWSASRLGSFTYGERSPPPSPPCIGSWMGPGCSLDAVERRKILPYRDPNSDPSAVQSVVSRYDLCMCLDPAVT